MAKRGALIFIFLIFFIYLFIYLFIYFFFFAVWRGAPKNFRDKYFLASGPPLQMFVNVPYSGV